MGVKKGIVQNGLSLAAHGVNLLQSAVPAAHTGGHHYQNRFFHVMFSSCLALPIGARKAKYFVGGDAFIAPKGTSTAVSV